MDGWKGSMREEIMRRIDAAVPRGGGERPGRSGPVGDRSGSHGTGVARLALAVVSLAVGVARACDVARDSARSGQRGVRGAVAGDRRRCARVGRVRCRAALGLVPNVSWDAGHARDTARRWRARCTSGLWRGIASGFTLCGSRLRCRAARGHGVPATVCTVRHSVPAISLAWWRVMRKVEHC
ncbi:hypothetical protein B0H14DRAFT_1454166 [Mycena olivaceomarginata]|nr:hypothetical protein B0H14DRAFT_1454166 [Mycena olivaceomarginata]